MAAAQHYTFQQIQDQQISIIGPRVMVGDVFTLKLMKQCPEEGLINAKETSGKQSSDCCRH
ncbi:hypothetical protein PMI18_00620 [Pseudomonas sp. GM102]|uniref:hypothetical protein n=1 Tax=Pseudomonas sp. GM102 TaxID=1144321 RepID=UPI00026F5471|nr:hypothetical protein [Pseudomonas sp. GM102]EJM06819.1 hypothetical protein PMI18_00620 [Pseudomonas sp. GM102]